MKNVVLLIVITGCFFAFSCNKEKESERFSLLTDPIWVTDSLTANGVDAGGPGGVLAKFLGDAKFKKDGTGYFGKYTGDWSFVSNETKILITSDSLPIPITTDILELTSASLKLKTLLPDPQDPTFQTFIKIRMTFKPK